jgi:hypothetical protein
VIPVTFRRPLCLYTATEINVARRRQKRQIATTTQTKDSMDTPLSQTNISLRLSLIRKQCEKLMQEEQTELTLEEPLEPARAISDSFNPYDSGN